MVIYILRLGKYQAININVNAFRSLLNILLLTSPHLLACFHIQLYHYVISLQVNVYISSTAKVHIDYRLRYAQLIASFPWTPARRAAYSRL